VDSPPVFHLVPAAVFYAQPANRPYLPPDFAAEGFIHCTAGLDWLVEVANAFFADFSGELLALQIDPHRLQAPLKFEPPLPPPGSAATDFTPGEAVLFPHIYGPLNREAIVRVMALPRNSAGRWQAPN